MSDILLIIEYSDQAYYSAELYKTNNNYKLIVTNDSNGKIVYLSLIHI